VAETAGRAAFASHSHDGSLGAPARHIVDIQDYGTWRDVIDHPREFIQALYSAERVDTIVERRPAEEPVFAAMS